jgi:mono/diheme cytochrome c family protein
MRATHMRAIGAVLTALASVTACKARDTGAGGGGSSASAGGTTSASGEVVALRPFTGDPHQAVQGRQLFITYNCYGCHGGLAGGAMGPSLRDTTWKYGGTDSALTASIRDGRPGGMPSWARLIPDTGIARLVVYIHSLRTSAEPTFFFSPTDTTTHADLRASAAP